MQVKDRTRNGPMHWSLPPLRESDHKYTRGHVLLLGGATMTGAAKLAAHGAQRIGTGLVTLAAPRIVWPIYAISMQSIITRPLDHPKDFRELLETRRVSAVLLGPGCAPEEVEGAFKLAAKSKLPLVLDAGALQLIADKPKLLNLLDGPFALLPHEGEFATLAKTFGVKERDAKALAKKLGGVVLLKGATSIIAAPNGRLLENHADAPWLATAGTGDVLAGMVAGLAAQGMETFQATAAAVWLHAEAAKQFGRGMIPEDLLDELPNRLHALQ